MTSLSQVIQQHGGSVYQGFLHHTPRSRDLDEQIAEIRNSCIEYYGLSNEAMRYLQSKPSRYKQVIIVDRSGSTTTVDRGMPWSREHEINDLVTQTAWVYNSFGIKPDYYFLDKPLDHDHALKNSSTPYEVAKWLNNKEPDGVTPIVGCFRDVINHYRSSDKEVDVQLYCDGEASGYEDEETMKGVRHFFEQLQNDPSLKVQSYTSAKNKERKEKITFEVVLANNIREEVDAWRALDNRFSALNVVDDFESEKALMSKLNPEMKYGKQEYLLSMLCPQEFDKINEMRVNKNTITDQINPNLNGNGGCCLIS